MKKQIKYGILSLVLVFGMTGCTTYMKGDDGKAVVNQTTGQSLPENILCRPTDPETIMLYEANGYDLNELPSCVCKEGKNEKLTKEDEEKISEEANEETSETTDENQNEQEETKTTSDKCEEFTITSGKYEGLWTSFFVKPLAWVILFFGKYTGSFGLGLIITSIIIRLIVYPLTKKSTMQTENMKKIQPEMDRLEKKYANKDKNDREVMMMKSQEMMAIYKKHNVNPVSGCLPALLQLPLFIAFLDAINRVPAIFEEKFLLFHLGTTPMVGIKGGVWWYLILTVLVAVTTYYSMNKASATTQSTSSNGVDMAKQTKTMMNGFTIMIIIMSVFMSSALNIYWVVSNLCTLVQNYLVKRSMK